MVKLRPHDNTAPRFHDIDRDVIYEAVKGLLLLLRYVSTIQFVPFKAKIKVRFDLKTISSQGPGYSLTLHLLEPVIRGQ